MRKSRRGHSRRASRTSITHAHPLLLAARDGSHRALARLMTLLEEDSNESRRLYRQCFLQAGNSRIIGVTGPPGVGKSTLTDVLADRFADDGDSVGIICVDPTSPFSRGAVLGDRVRMRRLVANPNVFIRSMASRGSLGGLAPMTARMAAALTAAGKETILIETVGTGQAEMDVAALCRTVVLVVGPHAGDAIQAMKAGVLEAADLIVVNKADIPGAEQTAATIRNELRHAYSKTEENRVSVVLASAEKGTGISEVRSAIEAHERFLSESVQGDVIAADKLRNLVRSSISYRLAQMLEKSWRPEWERIIESVIQKRIDPESAARLILQSDRVTR